MKTWKITWIWINYNYWFYNGWFINFKIWKKEYSWHSTDRLIEGICIKLEIYKENDMQKLNNKRFNILSSIEMGKWWISYEIEIINKKINPDKKSVWIYDDTWISQS